MGRQREVDGWVDKERGGWMGRQREVDGWVDRERWMDE